MMSMWVVRPFRLRFHCISFAHYARIFHLFCFWLENKREISFADNQQTGDTHIDTENDDICMKELQRGQKLFQRRALYNVDMLHVQTPGYKQISNSFKWDESIKIAGST